jgi:opacity protein-like surface antigen
MKRILAAVSFAVLAAPVYAADLGAPFEQTQLDRGVQNAQSDASTGASSTKDNVWADDYNFIAPAQ